MDNNLYYYIYTFIYENFTQGSSDTSTLSYWGAEYTLSETLSTLGTYIILGLMASALVLIVIWLFKFVAGVIRR